MYMSVCCTPGRIRKSPLPTLLCYFKRCCFNHTFDKKGIRRSSYWLTLNAVGDVVFLWRCVVDDINRCTCRCVVHPVGSEDPPYRHFELLIALMKLQRIKVSSLQMESTIFMHVFFSLCMVYDQPTAFSVLSVETTVLLFDLPMSVKNLFVRFCRFSSLIVDQLLTSIL